MKRLISILLILLLSFAGGMGIFHDHDHEEDACHETSLHFCEDSAHMDCSLCDVVVHPNDFSQSYELTVLIFGQDDYKLVFKANLFSAQKKSSSDRAPPIV